MAYQIITDKDSPNFTPNSEVRATYGQPRVIKGITIHWWGDPSQNPTFEGIVNYLCREGGNTSAHAVVTGTGRRVAWIVNAEDAAWHSGNPEGNATTLGFELDPRCRDQDYDVAAELIADTWKTYGVLPLYRHSYWSATTCPGNYDLGRLRDLAMKKYNGEKEEEMVSASGVNYLFRTLLGRTPDPKQSKDLQASFTFDQLEAWIKALPEYKDKVAKAKKGEVNFRDYLVSDFRTNLVVKPSTEAEKKLETIKSILGDK